MLTSAIKVGMLGIHNANAVRVGETAKYKRQEFFSRSIYVESDEGLVEISLFAESKDKLVMQIAGTPSVVTA